jgi:DNA-binding transcriptional LysR family regulator
MRRQADIALRFARLTAPGMVVVDPPCPVRRKLWLVMHDDVRRSPHVRAVADQIIAMFEQE